MKKMPTLFLGVLVSFQAMVGAGVIFSPKSIGAEPSEICEDGVAMKGPDSVDAKREGVGVFFETGIVLLSLGPMLGKIGIKRREKSKEGLRPVGYRSLCVGKTP